MTASSVLSWLPAVFAGRVSHRHETLPGDKTLYGKAHPMPTLLPETSAPPAPRSDLSQLSVLAERIIRQQWPLRRHTDPSVRRRAVSLIQSHVEMLRRWR